MGFDYNQITGGAGGIDANKVIGQITGGGTPGGGTPRGGAAGKTDTSVGGVMVQTGAGLIAVDPLIGGAVMATGLAVKAVDDILSSKRAQDKLPAARNNLRDVMNAIVASLGYPEKSKERWRCYFRLGEVLAKADPKYREQGWAYAGPNNNTVNSKDEEGSDFRTRTGRDGRIIGIEGHMQPSDFEEFFGGTGRAGQLLSIAKSVIETAYRLKYAFENYCSTQEQRRQLFYGCCDKWLAGSQWLKGMEFLPRGTVSKQVVDLVEAPRGKVSASQQKGDYDTIGKPAGNVPTVPAGTAVRPPPPRLAFPGPGYAPVPPPPEPAKSGSGPILAVLGAGALAYLAMKG
jgi:hypothetical protein